MELNILAVGDVVGEPGMERIRRSLPALRREYRVDFTVVNGENASVVGLTTRQAEEILDAGADVITLGNHSFAKREIVPFLDDSRRILRPANYAPQAPGRGFGIFDTKAGPIALIDLIGRCNMDYGPDNPFLLVEKLLKNCDTPLRLVEFHAEATSEKLAMGYLLDGRVSALWGTHTHVPTADCQVLPGGLGFVSDLGMTGPTQSVIGIRPDQAINRFLGGLPQRFQPADGPCKMDAVLFDIDVSARRCLAVQRVDIS